MAKFKPKAFEPVVETVTETAELPAPSIMECVRLLHDDIAVMVADIEARGRELAKTGDHGAYAEHARLVTVLGHCRAGLATVLDQ